MATALMHFAYRRNLRRNRIFRDRSHPLDIYDDVDLLKKFRFRRYDILQITDEICKDIEVSKRGHTVPPCLQVLTTLRFYATGTFQSACADLSGISQPTASRIIARVTRALLRHVGDWVVFPDQAHADQQKVKFALAGGFPNVIGCVDGTHIPIQAPATNEHEYVNRRNYHSINVQVICNADLLFIDVTAKWPGSVHDARILRQSALFQAFENPNTRPLHGVILGDSGYMLRDWLLTPLPHPETSQENRYNATHKATRSTVERAIGLAKKRWHCLRGLRLEPAKSCQVITVCLMLSNRALALNLPQFDEDDSEVEIPDVGDQHYDMPMQNISTERARVAAGQATRTAYISQFF